MSYLSILLFKFYKTLPKKLWLFLFNLYPSFFFSGVKFGDFDEKDFLWMKMSMRASKWNGNGMGMIMGANIYKMVDMTPLMLIFRALDNENLGYIGWDTSGSIEHIKHGTGRLNATVSFTKEEVEAIRETIDKKRKTVHKTKIEIFNEQKELVCIVHKEFYLRKVPKGKVKKAKIDNALLKEAVGIWEKGKDYLKKVKDKNI